MGVQIIGELVQKNGLNFPIIDSNNIRGGFYLVSTIAERDLIPASRKKKGMLCYVSEDEDKIYTYLWNGIEWVLHKVNLASLLKDGLMSKEDKEKLDNLVYDGLDSNNGNKALSANQGKILKELLDAKVIEAGDVPIDAEPILGNTTHIVNSDGLAKKFNKHNTEMILGSVYDISSHNNGAVFESLQALLSSSNLNTLIPTSVRHGGMSIRFIQSSDNKYVQYRLMSTAWSNIIADWQGVDNEPTSGSNNLVNSGGVAEKLSELEDNVSNIDRNVREIESVTIKEEIVSEDITDTLSWNQGYMANNGLVDSSVSSMHYTNKIEVLEGDVLATGNLNHKPRYITAFSGNTVIAEKGDNTGNIQSYIVPKGIDSVVLTFYTSAINLQINHTYTYKKSKADDLFAEVSKKIEQVENDISNVITIEKYTEYSNEEVIPIYTLGWCNPNTGTHVAEYETVFEHTQKIPVSAGDIVTAKNAQGSTNITFRWVACFNGDSVVPSAGSSVEEVEFTVPNGVTHIVPTLRISSNANAIVVSGIRESKAYNIKTSPLGYTRTSGNLSNGQTLYLPYHNIKNHNVIVFSANVSSFGSLKIGKQANTYVTIDGTNLSVTCDSPSANFTQAHGLTIEKNIQVIIENETSIKPSVIRVLSCGNEFNATIPNNARFLMDEGSHYATSINSVLTDCAFSWTSRHINKPIWLFGDSYFTWYAERWTYYLARDGFTESCMLNGFAGENSAGAYPALENLLKVHVPKIVVWCQGMNNPDTNTAVNESWKSYYDKVVLLSKKYGFELVLYTTPTTPTMNNRFKNEIVRNSGYRYIEADKSLRIDDNGNWIAGTLDDNVHPTPNGAKLLYYRFLADLPELSTKL